MNMVNVFDSTLGMSLEAFAGTELMTVNMLKQEAEQKRDEGGCNLEARPSHLVHLKTDTLSKEPPVVKIYRSFLDSHLG